MIKNYTAIRAELENWSDSMAAKDEFIIFSKSDIVDKDHIKEMKEIFEQKTGKKVTMILSAGAYLHIDELKDFLIQNIPDTPLFVEEKESEGTRIYDLKKTTNPKAFKIERLENGDFRVTGQRIEEIARMTDTRYTDGVGRVYNAMERLGILSKIKHKVMEELTNGANFGLFEGEDDVAIPSVQIGEKSFPLDNIIFMKE